MSAKNPNRYGKNSWPVSTTVPKEIFDQMEALAAAGGLKVTAWARQALTEAARSEAVYGMTKLKTIPIHTPIIYKTEEIPTERATGNISELPVPGSSPAKTPIRYQPKGGK